MRAPRISKKIPERLCLLWLCAWFGAAAIEIAVTPFHAAPFDYARLLASPGAGHWLGFDAFGRDLMAIALGASLKSATFAAIAVALATVLGMSIGCGIALARGWFHFAGAKGLAGLLAFPSLLFALAWAAIRGPGWDTLVFSLLIGTAPGFARYIQVRAEEILREDFILASRSLGASNTRIVFRHLLPSVAPFAAIKLPNLFAQALVAEATLSFLGIGAPIGEDTWGSLLAQGREYLIEAPHIAFTAGVPLVLTVLALQLLSEPRTGV